MENYNIDSNGVLLEYEPDDYEDDMYAAVPDGVKVISTNAFWALGHLISVHLPEGVEEIEDDAFFYCTQLNSINIPKSVKKIGSGAFYHCQNLKSIEVSTDTLVGDAAFAHCYNLADSNGFIIVNDVLYGYVGCSEELVIPQNVRRISGRAFEERRGIVKVTLPDGLLSIGEDAFIACADLEEINIPDSVIEIGDSAFVEIKVKI